MSDQLEDQIEQLTRRLLTVEAQHAELIQTLENIAAQGDELLGGGSSESDAEDVGCCAWAEQASDEKWHELFDWVDWFGTTYQVGEPFLMPCWPRHPGMVEDLAGLKLAWDAAVAACGEARWIRTESLEYWHDRYLPGFIQRARSVHGMHRCETAHEERKKRPFATDREGVVIASTGEHVA